jgi:transcriptional regulator with XRE-family HTH domain
VNLAGRIKHWRKHTGLSKAALARLVGVTPSAVTQWEQEDEPTVPITEHVVALASAFGVSLSAFWGALPPEGSA